MLQTKKGLFLLPFRQIKWKLESMKANLSQKSLKLASNDNYFTEELITEFKLFTSNWKRFSPAKGKKPSLFFASLVASFVPSNAGGDHMVMQSLE